MNYSSKFITFLQATKNLSDKTLSAYKSDLKQLFTFENNILSPDICAFVNYLKFDLKLKDASIRRKIITLKNFYAYMFDNGYVTASPFSKLKFRFKQERKLPKTLSVGEVSKILKCFDSNSAPRSEFAKRILVRDSALIDLLISTGICIGEAAAITLSDVILSERTVLYTAKEGNKGSFTYLRPLLGKD